MHGLIVPASRTRHIIASHTPNFVALRGWKPLYWFLSAIVFLVLQLLTGTAPVFALLVFFFALLTYLAISAAGGLATLMGACIGFMAAQNVLVSQIAKVAMGQSADAPLRRPVETMGAYDLAMLGIWLAAALSTRWTARRKPLFALELDLTRLMWLSYISGGLALIQVIFVHSHNADASGAGSSASLLNQVDFLSPLAVASGTAFAIRASNGRRSMGIVNGLMIFIPMVFGIIGGAREALVTGPVVYVITCLVFKFRFRFVHYAVAVGGLCLMQYILFPFALYARNRVRTPHLDENIRRAASILMDVIADPARYQNIGRVYHRKDSRFFYYGKSMPTLDRTSLLIVSDGIIDATLRQGTYTGMETITPGFVLAVPRMFNPEKTYNGASNLIAHRAPGLVGKTDRSTGITLGSVCDPFSSYGWTGAFVIPFLMSLVLFSVYRLIMSDRLWFNVLPISLVFHIAWVYSGAPISNLIVEVLQGVPVFAFGVWVIMILVNLVTHPARRIRRTRYKAIREANAARAQVGLPPTDMSVSERPV